MKLKSLLKESKVWERKFGEPLPTLEDTTKRFKLKQEEELNEQKVTIKDIEWFDLNDSLEKIARNHNLKLKNTYASFTSKKGDKFAITGKKEDLIKAFMELDFADGIDAPGTGKLTKNKVLKMFPKLK